MGVFQFIIMVGSKGGSDSRDLRTQETVAKAVVKDAWQNGNRCVELRRDGRRIIFFCTLCSTRCYNDTVLSDHLRGNQHKQRVLGSSASAFSSSCTEESSLSALQKPQKSDNLGDCEQSAGKIKGRVKNESINSLKSVFPDPESLSALPASSLEFIGSGQVLLREAQSEPSRQVKAVWCHLPGQSNAAEVLDLQSGKASESAAYSVIIFPYSDVIGRRGGWKPAFVGSESNEKLQQVELRKKGTKCAVLNNLLSVDPLVRDGGISRHGTETMRQRGERGSFFLTRDFSHISLRKALKKRRLNSLDRFCFICHQQMLPGKDVAALLNRETGQMMCSSRNKCGAFHVFHTCCLIDWVLLCEAKFWSAPAVVKGDGPRMRGQMGTRQQRARAKTAPGSNGPLFCPECQGTGVQISGHQLEKPRYRLGQVFDWILELIQARRSWMEHPEQRTSNRGLLFLSDAGSGTKPIPLGFVHFYAAGDLEFLVAAAVTKSCRTGV